MGVLFVMRSWAAPSELWMQRTLEVLRPDLSAVAALDPDADTWRGEVPAVSLGQPTPALWRTVCRRAGLASAAKRGVRPARVLARAVADPGVSAVVVNYLNFALRFSPVWRSTRKPVFVLCHGSDVTWDLRSHEDPDMPTHPPDYAGRARRLAGRALLVANSETTRRRLLDAGVPEERVRVKYFGVPAADEPPPHRDGTSGLEILFLGRLVDFKGPELVVRAFVEACSRGLDARLTIAGDGPMRGECETLARASACGDRIAFLGTTDADTGDALRARADIFTAHNRPGPLTRQEEAFGVAFAEAMAAALPVISGRSGSLPEVVAHGETGLLVEPGDVAAHAQAFLTLAADPALRRQMGEAGWRRVRERFSPAVERAGFVEILGLDRGA